MNNYEKTGFAVIKSALPIKLIHQAHKHLKRNLSFNLKKIKNCIDDKNLSEDQKKILPGHYDLKTRLHKSIKKIYLEKKLITKLEKKTKQKI